MDKETLRMWAKEHCSDYHQDEFIDSHGFGVYEDTYKFNWGGFVYRLTMMGNDDFVYLDRILDGDMISICRSLDEIAIVDDKLFIAFIPKEFY